MQNPLTAKQKAFVKAKLDNPKISNTDAAMVAYDAKDRSVGSTLGHNLIRNQKIIMALGEHNDLFESVIVKTAKDWQDSNTPRKREIALNAAMFGHDKVHGKATVKIDQQSTVVRVSINLTGDGEEPPAELLIDPEAN